MRRAVSPLLIGGALLGASRDGAILSPIRSEISSSRSGRRSWRRLLLSRSLWERIAELGEDLLYPPPHHGRVRLIPPMEAGQNPTA